MTAASFLCKLDPRTKILLVPFLTLLVFIVDRPLLAAGQTLAFFCLWFAAKMPFRKIRAYLKFLSALIVFVIVLQTLFGPGNGPYILKPLIPEAVPLLGGMGSLKWDGFVLGLLIGCRIVALVLLMPMLIQSTSSRLLALGFVRLGLNYRAAYIVTTALNLLPAFEAEGRIIMEAWKLRGLRTFDEGNFAGKLRSYPALVIPLIIGAMRRAQLSGTAMDARGFGAFRTKTWRENITMSARDYGAFAAAILYAALALILNFLL